MRVTPEDVKKRRAEHPNAVLMAHPECRIEVLDMADHVTSTSGMLRFAASSSAKGIYCRDRGRPSVSAEKGKSR